MWVVVVYEDIGQGCAVVISVEGMGGVAEKGLGGLLVGGATNTLQPLRWEGQMLILSGRVLGSVGPL